MTGYKPVLEKTGLTDDPFLVYVSFIVVTLYIAILLLVGFTKSEFNAYLKDNKCTLSQVEETGNRVHCGGACSRKELKKTYTCEIGQNLVRIE